MSAVIGLVAAALIKAVVVSGAKHVSNALKKGSQKSDSGAVYKGQAMKTLVPTAQSLRSISQIRSEYPPIETMFPLGTSVDDAKARLIEDIASRPFYTSDTNELHKRVEALRNAATLSEVSSLGTDLVMLVERANQNVFAESAKLACQNAALKIGFSKLEQISSLLRSDLIRFAATNHRGATIVTEIDAAIDRDVRIDAEILGLNDNTCHQVLDEFHAALEVEGIVISKPPRRAPTGGICALGAAKDFLSTQLSPKKVVSAPRVGGKQTATGKQRSSSKKQRRKLINSKKVIVAS